MPTPFNTRERLREKCDMQADMRTNAGRLFMVGLPGTGLDESTRELILRHQVHNFIYFKRNVRDPEQLRQLSASLRHACHAAGLPAPLIAIDQEGGSVIRLPPPFRQFPDARLLAESSSAVALLADYGRTCARELAGVGINCNLAPVLDVSPSGAGLFMERRSLGGDPARVAKLGRLVVEAMQESENGPAIAACAKHFPGLGAAVVDPHRQLPTVALERDDLLRRDLEPFRQAIDAGVAAVMTSHTLYPALDPERPATLSPGIITGLLRQRLGFDGLVITDDLEMGAIENEGRIDLAALQAFAAGADLLLICHDHDKVRAAVATVAGAVGNSIDGARVEASLRRIDAVRRRFALTGG